jgi:hypothetical protein
MKIHDRLALLLSIAAFFAAVYISRNVYEDIPHIEDEITYVWQARLTASGNLTIQSPVCPSCFLEPFVVDLNGSRFGKYPPGWPAMLSLGIRLGQRSLVNPFLSAFFIWLSYLLVKKLLDSTTALIATVLTVISPFFLMNASTLLAHPWSLLLAVVFTHAWLDTLNPEIKLPAWITVTAAVGSMGLLILTRPLTAAGICIPFFIHGLVLLLTGSNRQRGNILLIGIGLLLFSGLYLIWQRVLTGDFLTNPYILYWPYDRIGFGPNVGLHPDGHKLKYAYWNTKFSLKIGMSDLFGWPKLSWLFLPFGILAIRKKPKALLVASLFFSLVLVYSLYWIGSWLFGPRYYFEGIFSLTLLTAAGIRWLAGRISAAGRMKLLQQTRFVFTGLIVGVLVIGNLLYYLPIRLSGMNGLYGMNAGQMTPFQTSDAKELTPALVIVHPQHYWLEYGVLLELSDPQLDTPFIFIYERGPEFEQLVIDAFPDRTVIDYYPKEPFVFYIREQ